MSRVPLTRQLVRLPPPYRCIWIDGEIVVCRLPDMERVATIHNSRLFRDMLTQRGINERGYFLIPGDRDALSE